MKPIYGAVVTGVLAIALFVFEWDFGRRAQSGEAVVIDSGTALRSGLTIASVWLNSDGRPTRATLRAFYCRLIPDEQVKVRYLANDPETVWLAGFWPQHYPSLIAAVFAIVFAVAEAFRLRELHRRPAVGMLRDDYVGPRLRSSGGVTIPIDTSPRLWDRDLDG